MSAHPHPTTFPSPRQRATVLGLAVLLLALTPAADAARSTRTVSGIPITADWQRSGSAWTASGAADVGGMSLSDASLRLSGNQLTGSVDGLDVELFAGCSLQSASADIGLATGSTVRQDVSDAPVQDHQTYLYFDHSGGTELECAGLAMPLAGGSSQRLFINPSDPSIYVQASDVFSGSSQSSLAGATRKIAGVDIGEATIGLSSGGLVPWQASERDAGGKRESFDAHLVIGGDVEIKAGKVRVAVREGTQAYRFNSKLDGIEKTCTSGSLVIPAFSAPMIGDVDLPLGKGVACLKGSKIEISTTIGGNAWASVEALPKTIRDALGQLGTGDRSLGGSIDADTGRVELEIGGTYPVGPWNVQGALAVGSSGFQMKGKTDFKTGPLDFGGMKTTVQFLPEPRPARPRASDSPRPPSSCGRWRPRSWTTRKSTGSRPTSRSDDTSASGRGARRPGPISALLGACPSIRGRAPSSDGLGQNFEPKDRDSGALALSAN